MVEYKCELCGKKKDTNNETHHCTSEFTKESDFMGYKTAISICDSCYKRGKNGELQQEIQKLIKRIESNRSSSKITTYGSKHLINHKNFLIR